MVTDKMLASALETILKYCETSVDGYFTHAVYIPPAMKLRKQADAIEKKDQEIDNARVLLAAYKRQQEAK